MPFVQWPPITYQVTIGVLALNLRNYTHWNLHVVHKISNRSCKGRHVMCKPQTNPFPATSEVRQAHEVDPLCQSHWLCFIIVHALLFLLWPDLDLFLAPVLPPSKEHVGSFVIVCIDPSGWILSQSCMIGIQLLPRALRLKISIDSVTHYMTL